MIKGGEIKFLKLLSCKGFTGKLKLCQAVLPIS